jgi:hypothetical protein
MKIKHKIFVLVFVLFSSYILSYIRLRETRAGIWEKDGKPCVIFPADKIFLYYFFRPLSYIDSKPAGIGLHIGQHEQ